MLGGTSLRRSTAAAATVRQRASLPVRSQRLISSFATRATLSPLRASSISSLNSFRRPAVHSLPRLASARFNSTAAAATASAGASDADTTATSIPSGETAGTPFSEIPDVDISQIPEKIGYLKELGLDYGWGPSAMIQFMLENIHIYTGIPWWGSVVATAVVIRLALFHPTLQASETSAKLQQIKPMIDPIRQRMLELTRQQDTVAVVQEKQKMRQITEEHGIQSWKAAMPMLQVPLGFGCFRVMRGMSSLPVPALENEHFLWLTDLSIKDPTFILPIATGAMMYFTLRRGGETATSAIVSSPMGKAMVYVLPVISIVATSFWPSLLQLYFFASAALGTVQNLLISSPKFRRFAGISPLPTTKPGSGARAQDTSAQGRLRMIADQAAAEKAAAEVSFIDRAVDNLKSSTNEFRKEAQSQVDKFAGTSDNSKGSRKAKTQKEIEAANDYEMKRREETSWLRFERNEQLKEKYKKKS